MKKNINISLITSLCFLSFILTACDADKIDNSEKDCNYCFKNMPNLVNVNLVFNARKSGEGVSFTIYSGKAFVSDIFYEGFTQDDNIWLGVKPNVYYSAVASYKKNGVEVLVVNDFKVETEFLKYECDYSPCYYINETRCSLKLENYPN